MNSNICNKKDINRKIFDFLTGFLQNHEEREISINLICKEVSISRNTFYYHYSNLEELYADYLFFYENQFIEKTKNSNVDRIKTYYNLYKLEFNKVKAFLKMTNYSLEKHVELKINFLLPFLFNNKEEINNFNEMEKSFLAGGMITAEYYWAKNGFQETPDELAQKIKKIVNNIRYKQ